MKKPAMVLIFSLFIVSLSAAQASSGGTMYVAVKSAALKASTGFFARTNGLVNYGDRVTVLQVSGKYVQVRSAANSSLSGWIAAANLSAKQIVSGNTSTASAREVALAGKGFNQEVENAYKAKGNLNYADVDRVEALTVSENNLKTFLEDGRLSMGE